jgi:hypothetical protein
MRRHQRDSLYRPVVLLVAVLLPACVTADYGDAPDGDKGMEAGYYQMSGSGFGVYQLTASGVRASFETIGRTSPRDAGDTVDTIPGAYTRTVDRFFIGPLWRLPVAGDIPSREPDADVQRDPDGPTNLSPSYPRVPWRADLDSENATLVPGVSTAPSWRSANALVVIFVLSASPPAIFITAAHSAAGVEGTAYWNVAIDLDQDGAWNRGAAEWIAEDVPFPLRPGGRTLLVSHPFAWSSGGAGGGFGRLHFPVWARNMVTDTTVRSRVSLTPPATWDGRGPVGGFDRGEVEDYFIEWRPIGPRFGNAEGGDLKVGSELGTVEVRKEDLVAIEAPAHVAAGGTVECALSGAPAGRVAVLCLPTAEEATAEEGVLELSSEHPEAKVASPTFAASAELKAGKVVLHVERAPAGGSFVILAAPADETRMPGAGPVPIVGGARILIGD